MPNTPREKTTADRRKLVRDINRAFGRTRIKSTAKRLKSLRSDADFLDITNRLGFLRRFTSGGLSLYKRELTIPEHIRQFLTLAFRTAILHKSGPMPLRLQIVPGSSEAVRVAVTDRLLSIKLTRANLRRRAARPGATGS